MVGKIDHEKSLETQSLDGGDGQKTECVSAVEVWTETSPQLTSKPRGAPSWHHPANILRSSSISPCGILRFQTVISYVPVSSSPQAGSLHVHLSILAESLAESIYHQGAACLKNANH